MKKETAMHKKFISLLSSNTANFEDLLEKLENKYNVDGIHFDIMDGHFVKNFAFNESIIKLLRKKTKLIFETHLEIAEPELFFDMFIEAGTDIMTFHPQNCSNLNRALRYLKAKDISTSTALDLEIGIEYIGDYLSLIDNILILSVQPGFGMQKFNESIIEKIAGIKEIIMRENPKITISVDGGVNETNEKKLCDCGVDIIIYGSSFMNKL